ncbi:MAG: hypothetical protein Tsb0032_36830 [Kiloniellaceae bacterium]
MQDFDFVGGTGLLVHAAALLQVLGFVNRRQLALRGLTLAGSLVYLAYYYLHPAEPLWGAMFWSSVLALANGVGILRVLLERRACHPNMQHDSFLNIMKVLSPGEFRRLMQLAEWRVAEQPVQLTKEGEIAPSLYFITGGKVDIGRNGKAITLGPGAFIGEISFTLNDAATADVSAPIGTEYIEWPREKLRKAIERTPALGSSMERLFNQELARKLVNSWG